MDRLVQMSKEQYIRAMRPEVERILGQIADAVNAAAEGQLINGSEMQVRELMAELRQRAYQQAVQQRVEETEGAFSPSPGRQRQEPAQQGA